MFVFNICTALERIYAHTVMAILKTYFNFKFPTLLLGSKLPHYKCQSL